MRFPVRMPILYNRLPDPPLHGSSHLGVILSMAAITLIAAVASPAFAQNGGWIPFAGDEVRPSFAVSVDDADGTALLQPGLAVNALSSEFAERAGIREASGQVSITGIYGESQMPEARGFDIDFAGTGMRAEGFAILPAEMINADVVFGRPLFQGTVLQLDYPNRRLRILPPNGVNFEGNVDFKLSQYDRPMVRTRIEDRKMWMLLDTSSRGLCLIKSRVVSNRKWGDRAADPALVQRLGVEIEQGMQPIGLDEFELGPYSFEGFIAAYSPTGDHLIDAREKIYGSLRRVDLFDADGVLGYEILRNFVVTLDISGGKVHFYAP